MTVTLCPIICIMVGKEIDYFSLWGYSKTWILEEKKPVRYDLNVEMEAEDE